MNEDFPVFTCRRGGRSLPFRPAHVPLLSGTLETLKFCRAWPALLFYCTGGLITYRLTWWERYGPGYHWATTSQGLARPRRYQPTQGPTRWRQRPGVPRGPGNELQSAKFPERQEKAHPSVQRRRGYLSPDARRSRAIESRVCLCPPDPPRTLSALQIAPS